MSGSTEASTLKERKREGTERTEAEDEGKRARENSQGAFIKFASQFCGSLRCFNTSCCI